MHSVILQKQLLISFLAQIISNLVMLDAHGVFKTIEFLADSLQTFIEFRLNDKFVVVERVEKTPTEN